MQEARDILGRFFRTYPRVQVCLVIVKSLRSVVDTCKLNPTALQRFHMDTKYEVTMELGRG